MAARKRLGELLVEAGAVSNDGVQQALERQQAGGVKRKIGEVLVETSGVTPRSVAEALARQFELPFIELPRIPAHVAALVPREFQEQHKIVPFRLESKGMTEHLHIAIANPADLHAVDQLRFSLRQTLQLHVAAADDLDRALATPPDEEPVLEPLPMEEEPEAEFELSSPEAARAASARTGGFVTPGGPPVLRPVPQSRAEGVDVADATATAQELDALLGSTAGTPPAPRADPDVQVLEFKGRQVSARAAGKQPERLDFDEQDLRVLEDLEKLAGGAHVEGEQVRPERMVAALIRLLIRKGVIQELEFLDELSRK